MIMQKPAVLLLAHGTPERIEEIPAYLANVTGGRQLAPAAIQEIQRRYALIGRSPLTEITMHQAALISEELGLPTYVGMRNWKPYIRDAVARMKADGITYAIVICLAPQNSRTSVGLYRSALMGETGNAPFVVDFVPNWHAEPLLIRAFSEKLRDGWSHACLEANAPVPVLFTAHSVPLRTVKLADDDSGDDYERQTRQTAELVAASVPEIDGHWRFAFQSQGLSPAEWLGPTVESVIEEFAAAGHRFLFVQPIGFVCDHVEVLYDIDIAFKNFAAGLGIALTRAESLNDSVLFARAVAQLVRARLAAAPSSS
jgi:ferrochelatase